MISSLVYIFSVITLVFTVMLIQKTAKRLSLVNELVISILFVTAYITFISGIVSFIKLPITLFSLSICNFISTIAVALILYKTKKRQAYYINKLDIVAFIIFACVVLFVELRVFSWYLRPSYLNSDAAVHFQNAMRIVRGDEASGMYFTPLFNAIFIEICSPFLPELSYYKGMILADTVTTFLVLECIYIYIRNKVSKTSEVVVGIVVSILCFCGYPLYCYMIGGHLHWAAGVLLILYIVHTVSQYFNEGYNRVYLAVSLGLGLLSLSLSYMFFIPIIYLTTFIVLFLYYKVILKTKLIQIVIYEFAIFFPPSIITLYQCFFRYWGVNPSISFSTGGATASTNVTTSVSTVVNTASSYIDDFGMMYGNLFSDFLFALPVFILVVYYCVKNKKFNCNLFYLVFILLFSGVCFVLCIKFYISSYYYYKMYYPIWVLLWLLVIDVMVILKEQKAIFYSYFISLLLVSFLSGSNFEEKVFSIYPLLKMSPNASAAFRIYADNRIGWDTEFWNYGISDDLKELYGYVMNELNDEQGDIPLLIEYRDAIICYWYEGLTGRNSAAYYMKDREFSEVKEAIKQNKVSYAIVIKNSELYQENRNYFDSFDVVLENEEGKIIQIMH